MVESVLEPTDIELHLREAFNVALLLGRLAGDCPMESNETVEILRVGAAETESLLVIVRRSV
jgi:hypothetical protein